MALSREERIGLLAGQLAARAGNPPGRDLNFWLEAERLHDRGGKGWKITPRAVYANFIEKFLKDYDRERLDHISYTWLNGDSKLSIEDESFLGLRYLYAVDQDKELLNLVSKSATSRELFDVSLLGNLSDFEDMAKRSILMSDTALIGISEEPKIPFLSVTPFSYSEESAARMVGGGQRSTDYSANISPALIFTYLNALKNHMKRGDLFLLPRISHHDFDEYAPESGPFESQIFDAIIKSGKIKSFFTEDITKMAFLTFLVETEIPVVGGVPLSLFSQIYCEDIEQRNVLKETLRERFFELDLAKFSDAPEATLMKIGNKLKKDVRTASMDLRSAAKKNAIQAAGLTVGTAAAVLVAVNVAGMAQAAPLVSGAGGLAALYKMVDSYLDSKSKREANPFLFMWLLQRTKTNRSSA